MNKNDIIFECQNILQLIDFMEYNHYNINIINYIKKHLSNNDMINNIMLYDDMLCIIYKHGYPLQCEQFYMDLML